MFSNCFQHYENYGEDCKLFEEKNNNNKIQFQTQKWGATFGTIPSKKRQQTKTVVSFLELNTFKIQIIMSQQTVGKYFSETNWSLNHNYVLVPINF